MKCPTCGNQAEINVTTVRALIDVYGAGRWICEDEGFSRDGLTLVAKLDEVEYDCQYNPQFLVFRVGEDGSHWKLEGSADSYGEFTWDGLPAAAKPQTKTVTVWE